MSPIPHRNAILKHLRAIANTQGAVDFAEFSRAALFLEGHGYYAQAGRPRVGKSAESDFYTASSLRGGVFARLLLAAFETLLGRAFCESATLVEIAAEPGAGIFEQNHTPFAALQTLRLGEPLAIAPRAVVFANEWLDAQPFHRFVRTEAGWAELGVRVTGDAPQTCALENSGEAAARFIAERLAPHTQAVPVGYHFDISLEAPRLLDQVCAQPWQGAFVTADYGRFFNELLESFPEGTGRAYRRHAVSGDLLSAPGEGDLTCDVCWDDLESVLKSRGFTQVSTVRQEVFFMTQATGPVGEIVQSAPTLSPEKRALMELLHPGQLGARFQVLSGVRRA